MYQEEKTPDRLAWWKEAGFGMMIHWGLYSILAGEYKGQKMEYVGEWIMRKYEIPIAEYEQLAKQFNPQKFDADRWVSLAKEANMGYLVVTAKHHEGFCLFHSKVDSYNVVDATPFGRDIIKELADACRRHGLKFGIYYSQDQDWHEPNGGGYLSHDWNYEGIDWNNSKDFPNSIPKDYSEYFYKKVIPQVRELMTNYGEIAVCWFDNPLTISPQQTKELWDLVHELQPNCLVNSRIGNGYGDYHSLGDNMVPVSKVTGNFETAATLNDTWGYKYFDHNYKKPEDVLELLRELRRNGVNYLLNIGPMANGEFPEEAIAILKEIGRGIREDPSILHPAPEPESDKITLFAADASIQKNGSDIIVNEMQAIENWKDSRPVVSWKVRIPTEGTYRLEIATSALYHSNSWYGGHQVTFAWEDGKIQAELKGQVPIHNIGARYYPQSISQCGIISLTEGEHTFSLHADYIAPPSPEAVADAGLGLMWVRLIPC